MRERMREIKRRRQRSGKRKKLRAQLAGADNDAARQAIQAKITKTYPKYVPQA